MNRIWLIPAAVAFAVAATPVAAQSPDENAGYRKPAGRDRLGGWTPSAMDDAQAVPRPNIDPDAVRSAVRQVRGERAARPEVPGTSEAKDLASADGQRASGDVYQKPLYWAGKLFFRQGNDDFVCSAQFVSPNVILTAAHCVRDPDSGAWNSDFIFALQYRNGEYSQRYGYECVATKNGWVQPGFEKYPYDYALILVDRPSKTGYFGTHWGWEGQYSDAVKIGYPGGVADGQVMQVETGPIVTDSAIVQINHGNPADQRGSSGGAWIGNYSDGGAAEGNYIISVESFGFDDQPGVDYGPYLTSEFKDLWDYVENGCQ